MAVRNRTNFFCFLKKVSKAIKYVIQTQEEQIRASRQLLLFSVDENCFRKCCTMWHSTALKLIKNVTFEPKSNAFFHGEGVNSLNYDC